MKAAENRPSNCPKLLSGLDQPYRMVTDEEIQNQRLYDAFQAFALGILGSARSADLLLARVSIWEPEHFRRFGVLIVNTLAEGPTC